MNAKAWAKEVVSFCPGVGKGELVPYDKIEKQLNEQKASEEALVKEGLG